MNKTYKDTDLRKALHRKYADSPQLPSDFMAKMEQRMDAKPVAKTRKLWAWLSAAACILLIIGIGVHYQFDGASHPIAQSSAPDYSIEHAQSVNRARSVDQSSTLSCSIEHAQSVNRAHSVAQSTTVNPSTDHGQSINRPRSIDQSTTLDSYPDLHYAAADLTKDTIPYQDPARVDDFIAKLAANYDVKQGALKCSASAESNVAASTVYVFPDTKEIDVFGRLLQVACWYNSETPGYRLNFSQQQFFFELKDMRKQLHYRWIAERINGRILLYGTNAPIGVTEFSTCYQEYRNELMHINSINIKTKKI